LTKAPNEMEEELEQRREVNVSESSFIKVIFPCLFTLKFLTAMSRI